MQLDIRPPYAEAERPSQLTSLCDKRLALLVMKREG